MKLTPYRDLDCCCPSTGDLLRSSLERVELDPCPVHQAAEIAAREADRRRADALRHEAEIVAAIERIQARDNAPPPCSCLSTADGLRHALEGLTPAPCAAHPSTTAPSSPSFALNDNQSIAGVLRGALGRDATYNGEPPPAA